MTDRAPASVGERLTVVETELRLHVKSCDRKSSIQIGLLIAVLGATLAGSATIIAAALQVHFH